MTYEISQLDIPDRQLLPTAARSRTTLSTEIGEAIVTHTIFGRAKVRIIRKHDKMRRTLWLLALLGVAAATAAWQGWMTAQQADPLQTAEPPPAFGTTVQESVPAPQPEYLAQPAAMPPAESKQVALPQVATGDAPISRKPAQPGATGMPPGNPADTQPPSKPVQTKPAIVAKPRVLQPVPQPAASSPAAVSPPAVPLAREEAQLPAAGNKQATDPVDVQP